MKVLHIECAPEKRDMVLAELWEQGTAGVAEEDAPGGRCCLRAWFDEPFDATRWNGQWTDDEERDWVAVSRESWEPFLVGERFFLVPAWRDDPTPTGRLRLEIDSGTACGTGYHEATRLCLEALERWLRPGETFLDVGTGSGILAEAALMLGAGVSIGCDIDPDAVAWARGRTRAGLFVGSLRAVSNATARTLAANINRAELVAMAPDVRRALASGGRAILAGFQAGDLGTVERAVSLPRLELLEFQGWMCLVCGG